MHGDSITQHLVIAAAVHKDRRRELKRLAADAKKHFDKQVLL
jgi:hypothetical protein